MMATDISDKLLRIGCDKGFINDYSEQNAENLSFQNEQFGFVLCKESYHHFPRPHIALHEMLRVSEHGVFLIEPLDSAIKPKLLNKFIPLIRCLLGKPPNSENHRFETVGNYIFSVSERELEKVQLGMHRRFIAYMYFNDYYEDGFPFVMLNSTDKTDIKKIRKAKRFIKIRDILARFGLIRPGLLATILFKYDPNPLLLQSLKKAGWKIKELPRNPYI